MSSTAPSSTSSSPTPTESHHPRPTETGINIPTSTVVAIGAGFVCFALIVLGTLLLIRLIRLFFACRRDGTPFREAWAAQGGVFGWLHGVGSSSSSRPGERGGGVGGGGRINEGYMAWLPASGLGAGGWYASEVARMRIWNEVLRAGQAGQGSKELEYWGGKVPALWEVDVGGRHVMTIPQREKGDCDWVDYVVSLPAHPHSQDGVGRSRQMVFVS